MKPRTGGALAARPLNEFINLRRSIVIMLPIADSIFGETPLRDLVPICVLVRRLGLRRIFEFGTFTGATTRAMLLNAPAGSKVWTIDLDAVERAAAKGLNAWNRTIDDQLVGSRLRGSEEALRVQQILQNSLEFDPQPWRGSMDLVYVDGSHGYNHVVNDTCKAFEMLAPRGIILWHDYPNFAGVRNHLEELPASHRPTRIRDTNLAIFGRTNAE